MKTFLTCTSCGRIVWRNRETCVCGHAQDAASEERATDTSVRFGCALLAALFTVATLTIGVAFARDTSSWYLLLLAVLCGGSALDYWHSAFTGKRPLEGAVLIDMLFLSRMRP